MKFEIILIWNLCGRNPSWHCVAYIQYVIRFWISDHDRVNGYISGTRRKHKNLSRDWPYEDILLAYVHVISFQTMDVDIVSWLCIKSRMIGYTAQCVVDVSFSSIHLIVLKYRVCPLDGAARWWPHSLYRQKVYSEFRGKPSLGLGVLRARVRGNKSRPEIWFWLQIIHRLICAHDKNQSLFWEELCYCNDCRYYRRHAWKREDIIAFSGRPGGRRKNEL